MYILGVVIFGVFVFWALSKLIQLGDRTFLQGRTNTEKFSDKVKKEVANDFLSDSIKDTFWE